MTDLKQIVFDDLDSAACNGAFKPRGSLFGCGAEDIAVDGTYSSHCEGREPAELIPYIREWLNARKPA